MFIEFYYDLPNGETIMITGSIVNKRIKFTAYNSHGDEVSKRKLSTSDIENIEEYIQNNADEIETESDFYNRYDNE